MKYLVSIALTLPLSGCFTLDKERITEQRQEDLCTEVQTKDLPHCIGYHEPEIPPY